MSIGGNIREYRKSAGLSRDELAYRLGVTEQTVAQWEKNNPSPDGEQLVAVARELGVSISDISADSEALAEPEAPVEEDTHGSPYGEVSLKLVTPVEELLEPGERILWAGKPSVKTSMGLFTGGLTNTAWVAARVAFVAVGILGSLMSYPPILLLAIPFVAFGAIKMLSASRASKKLREAISYAVTDRRVIIRNDSGGGTVKFIDYNDINSIRFEEGPNGTGSLVFSDEEDPPQRVRNPFTGGRAGGAIPLDGLYDIPDARKVCDIFRNILA